MECHRTGYSNKIHDAHHDYLKFSPADFLQPDNVKQEPSNTEEMADGANTSTGSIATGTKIIFGDEDAPTLGTKKLVPLNEEVEFLSFIARYGITCQEVADQFIQMYPEASCIRKIEGGLSEKVKVKPGVTYPTPDYIIKHLEDIDNITASALADVGYLTKIGDFSASDALNDAEEHVAIIGNTSLYPERDRRNTVTHEEVQLRNAMMSSWSLCQRERHRQHCIIKEHGLAGLHLTDTDFSPNQKATPAVYQSLANVSSKADLEEFIAGVSYERKLREKIQKLQRQKELGVSSKIDQIMFEKLDVQRRIEAIQKFKYVT